MPFDRVPLLAAIAGCNKQGVVMTHFDRTWCHCSVPWSGAIVGAIAGGGGGECTRWRIGRAI